MKQQQFKKRDAVEIDCAKYITRARKKGGINQTQLEKLIKVPATNISRYELNKTKMTLNMFLEVCRAVGVTDFNEIFKEEIELNQHVSLDSFLAEIAEEKRKKRLKSGAKKPGRPKKK